MTPASDPWARSAFGENTDTLARFSLLSQGEPVHVASYIALPVAPPDYDMAEAIRLRAAAHSFEGKVFTVVSCSTVSDEIVEAMSETHSKARGMLARRDSAFSAILGLDGRVIGEPLIDVEGIVYAEMTCAGTSSRGRCTTSRGTTTASTFSTCGSPVEHLRRSNSWTRTHPRQSLRTMTARASQ